MITVENKIDSHNWIKVWCQTCAQILLMEDALQNELRPLTPKLAEFESSRHEQLHPTHNIYLTTYSKEQNG